MRAGTRDCHSSVCPPTRCGRLSLAALIQRRKWSRLGGSLIYKKRASRARKKCSGEYRSGRLMSSSALSTHSTRSWQWLMRTCWMNDARDLDDGMRPDSLGNALAVFVLKPKRCKIHWLHQCRKWESAKQGIAQSQTLRIHGLSSHFLQTLGTVRRTIILACRLGISGGCCSYLEQSAPAHHLGIHISYQTSKHVWIYNMHFPSREFCTILYTVHVQRL